ncbi:hypothetical protein [Shewanella glacialimarina]|uniref:hypothetical protein n=1 Tax=Shewanella glacialimarina TaxID=2590884 RepID=UPI001CF85C43|nr:hypothetical protein [Shewanella glacialimarina]UCX04133.1 hypothetical protein FJ709_06215 [Shewanella glacialimarina]
MFKSAKILQLAFFIFSLFLLSSCGHVNDDPSELTYSGSTIRVQYSKGPVVGATALLKDGIGTTIAGPVTTDDDGKATFDDITYLGLVYTVFSGGTYVDETTGMIVVLDSSFQMRSGVIDNTGAGTLELTATPLTEIGFKRAISNNNGAIVLNTVNDEIDRVANDFGLDGIDLTTVIPSKID